MYEKIAITQALAAWVDQRPGLEARDYISSPFDKNGIAAYQADKRKIIQQREDAKALLRVVESTPEITADDMKEAFRSAFAGRLSWDGKKISYVAGQYFPTEYRAAACAVLASVLWYYWRKEFKDDEHIGDAIRKRAREVFGRGIASRWF